MFKYYLFVFVFCYLTQRYVYTQSVTAPLSQNHNCSQVAEKKVPTVTMNGHNNYHVAQQVFYVYGEQQLKRLLTDNKAMENLGDYLFTPDIGAHKLHSELLFWNDARKICIKEGGHLAVIDSATEERILFGMMQTKNVKSAWLGLHDLYEEGDWVTIKDEPLQSLGYKRWTTAYSKPQPDNANGNQNCAYLGDGGMDDGDCRIGTAFFCEISL